MLKQVQLTLPVLDSAISGLTELDWAATASRKGLDLHPKLFVIMGQVGCS